MFLASPTDLRMRGLLIEVNNSNLTSRGGATSSASNEALGKILVERGNASLVGLAVNQMGQVSATTSVALNGSIFLRARDGASKSSATVAAQPTNGGALVLGPGSLTEVQPTLGDTGTVAGSAFTQSWVDLAGRTVHLQANAGIVAPGGIVDITARVNPTLADNGATARVYLEPGAGINVAGTDSTRLAMESNVIEVQLRGTELADFPLNRDSPIRGSTVAIDVRRGTRVANVQGYLDLVGHNVGELSASGGTVTLRADGDVILAADSIINVSGGAVTYERGYAVTSQLKSQGALFDIGVAKNERVYDGVETWKPAKGGVASDPPARYLEESYREGRSAGSIRLDAANLLVRGSLAGSVTRGPRQRELGGSDASRVLPRGGELVLGNPDSNGLISNFSQFDVRGTIAINGTGTASTATPGFAQSLDAVDPQSGRPLFNAIKSGVDIDATRLTAVGFARLRAYTLGDITVGADAKGGGIDLGPGGELSLAAQNAINIGAAISAPGGKLSAASALSSITSPRQPRSTSPGAGPTIAQSMRRATPRATASRRSSAPAARSPWPRKPSNSAPAPASMYPAVRCRAPPAASPAAPPAASRSTRRRRRTPHRCRLA